jgi:AmmeMemoRadiSam system protein A
MEHELVKLARASIESYVKDKKKIALPEELSPLMKERAGVFVSLHKNNALRGCIGTFSPSTENVALEIINNAIESAAADPRFPPVRANELADLEIKVDVLTAPEQVASISDLDAKKYGVIIKAGNRRGLLLPDLEGVNTPEEQIEICKRKAGIGDNEKLELFRFQVRRYV